MRQTGMTTQRKDRYQMTHEPNTPYQRALAERAPEMNALHMETLAYSIGSTLNGMPKDFFDEVAEMARRWGANRLAEWHDGETAHLTTQRKDTDMTINFDFISSYNGKSDYRIYRDGKYNTRITADHTDMTLSYSDASPALQCEVDAFNAMKREEFDKARAIYPETGPAPVYHKGASQ